MSKKEHKHNGLGADKASDEMTAEQALAGGDKRFVSAGERIHNELTYRGVDLALNAASGIAFTFLTSRTKVGQKYYTQPLTQGFEKLLNPLFKNTAEPAKWGTKFFSIMFGGTVTIPPIMYLEDQDNKLDIIKGLDKLVYGEERVKEDPCFAVSYKAISQEPEKDFGTGMNTRFLALAPLFTAALTMPRTMTKYMYDPVAAGSKWVCRQLKLEPKGFLLKEGMNEEGKMVSNWEQLHRLVGFDLGLTAVYSVLHEWAYKAASAFNHEHEHKAGASEPLAQDASAELTQELREEGKTNAPKPKLHDQPDTKIATDESHYIQRVGAQEMAQRV